jgi:hypothetical protein
VPPFLVFDIIAGLCYNKDKERDSMEEIILNVSALPAPLYQYIRSEKVKARESNGVITLTPVDDKEDSSTRLFGMFSDGRLSVDKFMAQKRADKEFEE